MNVTACLVTRGDHDITEIVESWPAHWEQVIWDNSQERDMKVYGRYEAIDRAQTDVVFVQDDDCVLPSWSFTQLVAAYKPGVLVANMPEPFRAHYTDSCLLGFGAIFDKRLPWQSFSRLKVNDYPQDFEYECDVYFTALAPKMEWVDVQYENLPWATGDDRMYRRKDHIPNRARALELARQSR
jgi:hypothetical protein